MVSPAYMPPADSRRSAHRQPYPQPFSASDHRQGSSGYYSPFQIPRDGSMSSGSQDEAVSRKRIPVACGRCRKRKIRCSGDDGQGGQCTNCRNAGVTPCQFLRVSSEEALMKHEPGFHYNLADSRTHQAGGLTTLASTQPPIPPPSYHEGLPPCGPGPVDVLPYRGGPAYTYGPSGGGRAYLPWAPAGYCDAVPEPQGEVGYQHHGLYINYPAHSGSRYLPPFQPATEAPKPLPSYVDTESDAYGFGTTTTSLVHRPAPTNAVDNSWFHSISSGHSSSADSDKECVPAVERPGHGSGLQHLYTRNSSICSSAAYSKSSSSPTNSLSEATPASSYGTGSYSASPVSSSQPAVPSTKPRQKMLEDEAPSMTRPGGGFSATTTATTSAPDFPPPPTCPYVYTDTTAAAAAAAAAHRETAGSPAAVGHSCTPPPYVMPGEVSGGRRKDAVPLRP